MRIGIDVSQLAYPGSGVASYTENLIENLLKIDKKNEYVFFFSSLRGKIQSPKFKNRDEKVKFRIFKLPPLFLEFLWNRLHIVPIEKFTGRLDVFHSSDWLEPPAKCPKVTTIHDLAIFKYPETFASRGGHNIVKNLKRKFEWVKKESKIIIAVSENTKKDIEEILKVSSERIKVIYEACDEIFSRKRTKKEVEKIRKKYEIKNDYILVVGTLEPRKNLKRVIEAHQSLVKITPFSLVVAGKMGWGEDLGHLNSKNSDVKFLGYVPKEELAFLYAGAKIFVYPSLYEGFGLPILEAMASGCPVVTSNISSMPEVAGKAAILVNPKDVEDIKRGIKEALKKREDLIKRGFERIKQFSWEKTARETLGIYKEACKQ